MLLKTIMISLMVSFIHGSDDGSTTVIIDNWSTNTLSGSTYYKVGYYDNSVNQFKISVDFFSEIRFPGKEVVYCLGKGEQLSRAAIAKSSITISKDGQVIYDVLCGNIRFNIVVIDSMFILIQRFDGAESRGFDLFGLESVMAPKVSIDDRMKLFLERIEKLNKVYIKH